MCIENKKLLSFLGIMTKAGKIVSGEEMTINYVRANKVELVLIATDASDNAKKKLKDKCNTYGVKAIEMFTSNEISNAIGKVNRKVIAVTDKGFKEAFLKKINSKK